MAETARRLIVILGVASGCLVSAPRADACSCIGARPACQALWDPGAVFTGKVVSIESRANAGPEFFGSRLVRFEVAEAFRGVSTAVVEASTGSGGGDCGYPFVVGQSYLVYALQADGSQALTTGICSRTRPLSEAAEDLAYMRTLPATGSLGATITGSVHHRDRNISPKPGVTVLAPVASMSVTMDCDGAAYRGTTDANGRFLITGVPVGTCYPRLERSGGDFLLTANAINLPDPRACADVDLIVGTRRQ
jgi:hypothetical protein